MPEGCLPKKTLYSELKAGKRHPGSLLKHFKDNLKAFLKACSIPVHIRSKPFTKGARGELLGRLSATGSSNWCLLTNKGVTNY
ncbi:hypothetical protein HOLleu_11797 [Holothuria leucospilota]|uniref:Uncharacterized protein n=1 Tax=Holothuria leucospilota TaxID=206669 RepID=A0A9Q1H9P2_HOLLE|nr:hypothetical protein HOLleu_11797 [Holothuria leucospilota]